MQEDQVKLVLIEYLKKNNTNFLTEVNFGNCRIDFLIKNNNNWFGVEVKGDRSDEISTLGQLINYYKNISHLMLCAPASFIEKIRKLITKNPELSQLNKKLGYMSINDGGVTIIEPQNSKYYFLVNQHKLGSSNHQKFPKHDRPDAVDLSIIELIRTHKIITLGEIGKLTKLSYENTRKKIKNLEHFGYVKILAKYPTSITIGDKIEERKTNNQV